MRPGPTAIRPWATARPWQTSTAVRLGLLAVHTRHHGPDATDAIGTILG